MKKSIVVVSLLAAYAASAAEPEKSGSSNVMKGLMKDAVDTSGGTAQPGSPREGIDPNAKPPPDVTKMPFSQQSIKTVIAYHQPQIQACYEETLASKEKVMEGKLLTSFVITGEGMVKNAKVEKKGTTLKEPKLHECVIAVLSSMTFPKPVDGRDPPDRVPLQPEGDPVTVDFELSETQKLVRDTARKFARERVAPGARGPTRRPSTSRSTLYRADGRAGPSGGQHPPGAAAGRSGGGRATPWR